MYAVFALHWRSIPGQSVITSFDIVLPLNCAVDARGSDLERAKLGLFPSLVCFKYDKLVRTINVACQVADLALIQNKLAMQFPQFNYNFLIDEEMAPFIGYTPASFGHVPGWLRQQMLKLAAVAQCDNAVVLVLDADVIATAPIIKQLTRGNALPYQAMGIAQFEGWFRASAMALAVDFSSLDPASVQHAMGVTPEFLWTKTVTEMLSHLKVLAGAYGWGPYLMRYFKDYSSTWTEYSLYWVWHAHCRSPLTPHYTTKVYDFFENADLISKEIIVAATSLFAVLQSTKLTLADCRPVYEALIEPVT